MCIRDSCRHGDGYANSDIDRLNMQRYFYAGLFKRARAMGVTDILNQLPLVFKNYIKTDMDISTIAKLVVSFLKLDSSNIILAQTPVFMGVPNVGKTDTFAGYSCVVPDAGSIANLLNQYFCTYTGPIDVSEMNLVTDEWPHGSASTDANVQYMGRIDKESDDAILNGDINNVPTKKIPYFDFEVPTVLNGVDTGILDPRDTYADASQWEEKAKDLAGRFIKNFAKYEGNEHGKALVSAGPQL